MNNNLKLAVLAFCQTIDENSPFPPHTNYLELTISDVGALQTAAADQTRKPIPLPYQRPNCKVRASRTFFDHRDNRAIAEELAGSYEGVVREDLDPFFCSVVFQVSMAERIMPAYFLKPLDQALTGILG
ncbi:MAG: hypothetical protein HY735_30535 [Verrucomicrobia bacterium]|nr:hypothetical protein [Verrucomicrobiota bacterium]